MAIGSDTRSFAKRLRKFADDLPRQQNEIKKAVAKEIVNQVVAETPVDSGQARSNWFTALGAPDTTSVTFGPFGGLARGGTVSYNRGYAVISRALPQDKIYISNNLPYIQRLNQGYSPQAPANFVEIAIKRGEAIIAKQRIRYKV